MHLMHAICYTSLAVDSHTVHFQTTTRNKRTYEPACCILVIRTLRRYVTKLVFALPSDQVWLRPWWVARGVAAVHKLTHVRTLLLYLLFRQHFFIVGCIMLHGVNNVAPV